MMHRLSLCVAIVALLAADVAAQAQYSPAPVQSTIQLGGQDLPVKIEAASLQVSDKRKMATFSGNVRVAQGDTTMKCRKLIVFYGEEFSIGELAGSEAKTSRPAGDAPETGQNIRRIEARGDVTVVTKDQTASGDFGVYDLIEKTITLFRSDDDSKTIMHLDKGDAQ